MIRERYEKLPDGIIRHRELQLELADWEFAEDGSWVRVLREWGEEGDRSVPN
jgi:hypothetical protein